jgi:hypothetical protein
MISRRPVKHGTSAERNRVIVRRILKDKYGGTYIPLTCGHVTSPETDNLYRGWSPKGTRKHYCETCGTWQRRQPQPKRLPVPPEPLF